MSNVSGVISVAVEFRDSTTLNTVDRVKTIALRDAKEYTTGKVAIASGTVGTAGLQFLWDGQQDNGTLQSNYRNANGSQVAFASIGRIALSGSNVIAVDQNNTQILRSVGGRLSVGDNLSNYLDVCAGSGTTDYTIVLYGT